MRYDIRTGIKKGRAKIAAGTVGLMAVAFPSAFVLINTSASAATNYSITPWTFVGAANDCFPGSPPGNASAVVSRWDNTTGNPPPSLYLQKFALTADCSAAGATVNGVNGITLTELNFDYRNDGHCGAGAPRYNVVTTDNVTHFFGCFYGTHTLVGTDWTHVEFAPTDGFPAVTPTEVVQSIDIVFDEGTDQGRGYAYLDNFSVNGQIINKATPTTKDDCKNNGWMNLVDANGNTFKNQGDCVSYVATKGRNPGAGPASGNPTSTGFASGNVALSDPDQTLSFVLHDNGASATDTGIISYSNPSATLAYTTTPTCVNVSGSTAYFAYVIPPGHDPYSGTWVVWKVVDNSPDSAGFTTAPDMAGANAICEAGSASVTNYSITAGDIIVL